MIEEILKYNDTFVSTNGYRSFVTDKYPRKRLAILTCMGHKDCIKSKILKHLPVFRLCVH